MKEYLIIYLYADGLFEANETQRVKVGECLNLDDLVREGWQIRNLGHWILGQSRGLYWTPAVMEREDFQKMALEKK